MYRGVEGYGIPLISTTACEALANMLWAQSGGARLSPECHGHGLGAMGSRSGVPEALSYGHLAMNL